MHYLKGGSKITAFNKDDMTAAQHMSMYEKKAEEERPNVCKDNTLARRESASAAQNIAVMYKDGEVIKTSRGTYFHVSGKGDLRVQMLSSGVN